MGAAEQGQAQASINYPPAQQPAAAASSAHPPAGYVANVQYAPAAGPPGASTVDGIALPPGGGAAGPPAPQEKCTCTAGWMLFGLGFLVPLCWLVAALLPCCIKNSVTPVNDKRAAVASGVAFMTYTTLILLFTVILPLSLHWYDDPKKSQLATAWTNTL